MEKNQMQIRLRGFVSVLACAGIAATAHAQFGHPLKGTWSGDWGTGNASRHHVLLELDWDGKAITGRINPGPNVVAVEQASLDPATWMVHFEGDGKDPSGNTVHYAIDGKLQNLGSHYRFITGTWGQGAVKGDFKMTRN